MNRLAIIALAALFSVSLSDIALGQKPQKAADFTFTDQNGKTIQLSKLKGKAVLVNFWATWCGPCRAEMPGFVEVYNQYKTRGLEIIGISLDEEGWDVVRPFLQRYKINFPVVIGDAAISSAYGEIQFLPTSFLIDKNGNIVDQHVGLLKKEDLEAKVKKLL
jgi:peroxiredoxin